MGPVEIRLATGSRREDETRALLEGLLKAHDLSRFLFTVEVVIAAGVVPHSHPTLTLNTRHNGEPDRLLATFLHEQLHWFAHARSATVNDAAVAVAEMFPDLPVGHPRGARDLRSSRLHIIINRLELLALAETIGRQRAELILRTADHHMALYALVLEHGAAIDALLARHGLAIDNVDARRVGSGGGQ